MTKIVVTNRQGAVSEVAAQRGDSLMYALKFTGGHEISADCGGNAICGTCHVYLDDGSAGLVPPANEFETDLLDQFVHVDERSRLACQIQITESLEELHVTIAPRE